MDSALKGSDKYFGSPSCLLFTLAPTFHVYRPTGLAKNFALYNPPQKGQLATTSYLSRSSGPPVPEVLGFGGQTARFRMVLEDDMKVLRWHASDTTYGAHASAHHGAPSPFPTGAALARLRHHLRGAPGAGRSTGRGSAPGARAALELWGGACKCSPRRGLPFPHRCARSSFGAVAVRTRTRCCASYAAGACGTRAARARWTAAPCSGWVREMTGDQRTTQIE